MEGVSRLPSELVYSFSDLTRVVAGKVKEELQIQAPTHDAATPRVFIPFFSGSGGCNDAFTGFGFLAFLLALLDLILELQNNTGTAGDGGRSVRDVVDTEPGSVGEVSQVDQPGIQSSPHPPYLLRLQAENGGGGGGIGGSGGKEEDDSSSEYMDDNERAWAGVWNVYQGFLNAQATRDAHCARRFLCEGAGEAAATGRLGALIAKVASVNAGSWLSTEDPGVYNGVGEAGVAGAGGANCNTQYSQCFSLPPSYIYPRIFTGQPLRDYRSAAEGV